MSCARNRLSPVLRVLTVFGLASAWVVACGGPQPLGDSGSVCFRADDCQAGLACVHEAPGSAKSICSADLSGIVSMVDGAAPEAGELPEETGGTSGAAAVSAGAPATAGAQPSAGAASAGKPGAGGAPGAAGAAPAAGAPAGGAASAGAPAGGAPAGGAPAGGAPAGGSSGSGSAGDRGANGGASAGDGA